MYFDIAFHDGKDKISFNNHSKVIKIIFNIKVFIFNSDHTSVFLIHSVSLIPELGAFSLDHFLITI